MATAAAVLLLDDGELDDVRAMLDELECEYTHLRGAAIDGLEVSMPRDLFVTTPRRAVILGDRLRSERAGIPGQEGPVRMVVVSEDSKTLRSKLRDAGFDYLVRRPVHPAALRLLIVRALYRGPERRIAVRVPIGAGVTFRTGLRKRPATLIEIAARGCRLFSARAAEPDTRITVQLPKDFTGGKPLSLPGWVTRCEADEAGAPRGQFALAVAFETLDERTGRRLKKLLHERSGGPESISEEEAARARPRAPAETEGDDRRWGPRHAFVRKIFAFTEQADRVLVGRNLSRSGMLVESSAELSVGDEMHLAIFGRPREEPVVVRARVMREDGDEGLALHFLDLSAQTEQQLESLVASMPAVERLADGEAEAMGTVVAEILCRDDTPTD